MPTQLMTILRSWVRGHPTLKALLRPLYTGGRHALWLFRKHLTHQPVGVRVGNQHVWLNLDGSIPQVLFKGGFETNELDFVKSFLKPGMTVVDAGANVGLYSLVASVLVRDTGRVYAFEPGKQTFAWLKRNLILNNCSNVVPNNTALSNSNMDVVLSVDPSHPTLDSHCFIQPNSGANHLLPTDELVRCQTLDDYFIHLGCPEIDFIKIDVEGAELFLLQGAEKVLASSPHLTILLECTQNREQVRALLEQKGFRCYAWDSGACTLRPVLYSEVVRESNVIFKR